jgi:uncharacterized protein YjbJ (UPF0337 family)
MAAPKESAQKAKGDVKEVVGALTGDRRVEAEGRVEQRAADADAPVTDDTVDQEERHVKKDHHDVPGGAAAEGPLGT